MYATESQRSASLFFDPPSQQGGEQGSNTPPRTKASSPPPPPLADVAPTPWIHTLPKTLSNLNRDYTHQTKRASARLEKREEEAKRRERGGEEEEERRRTASSSSSLPRLSSWSWSGAFDGLPFHSAMDAVSTERCGREGVLGDGSKNMADSLFLGSDCWHENAFKAPSPTLFSSSLDDRDVSPNPEPLMLAPPPPTSFSQSDLDMDVDTPGVELPAQLAHAALNPPGFFRTHSARRLELGAGIFDTEHDALPQPGLAPGDLAESEISASLFMAKGQSILDATLLTPEADEMWAFDASLAPHSPHAHLALADSASHSRILSPEDIVDFEVLRAIVEGDKDDAQNKENAASPVAKVRDTLCISAKAPLKRRRPKAAGEHPRPRNAPSAVAAASEDASTITPAALPPQRSRKPSASSGGRRAVSSLARRRRRYTSGAAAASLKMAAGGGHVELGSPPPPPKRCGMLSNSSSPNRQTTAPLRATRRRRPQRARATTPTVITPRTKKQTKASASGSALARKAAAAAKAAATTATSLLSPRPSPPSTPTRGRATASAGAAAGASFSPKALVAARASFDKARNPTLAVVRPEEQSQGIAADSDEAAAGPSLAHCLVRHIIVGRNSLAYHHRGVSFMRKRKPCDAPKRTYAARARPPARAGETKPPFVAQRTIHCPAVDLDANLAERLSIASVRMLLQRDTSSGGGSDDTTAPTYVAFTPYMQLDVASAARASNCSASMFLRNATFHTESHTASDSSHVLQLRATDTGHKAIAALLMGKSRRVQATLARWQMELFDCDGKVVACLISSPWRLRAFACADFDEVPIFYPAEPRDMRAPVEPAAPEPASRRK